MKHFLTLLEDVTKREWTSPALTNFHGDTFSHAQVAEQMQKFQLLFQEIGLEKGDKIAITGRNSAQWVMAFLSAMTSHMVAVPILAGFTPENILTLTHHSDAKVLFVDKASFNGMDTDRLPQVLLIIDVDNYSLLYASSDALRLTFESLENNYHTHFPTGLNSNDVHYEGGADEEVVIINYTSGTTGTPKGIMIPARAISSNMNYALRTIPNSSECNAISMLPLGHMYGLAFEFLYTFMGGCHVYFLTRVPSPTVVMAAFAEIHPYILITVPLVMEKIIQNKVMPILAKPFIRMITHLPGINHLIYSSIHRKFMDALGGNICEIPAGGAAINPEVERILRKARIPISVGYGMTECAPLIGYVRANRFRKGSCGRAVDNMQVRVDSPDPMRIAGELQVKGDNVMLGYYKNPEATKEAFTEDGWMRTGDLGIIDKDGYIFIKGRSKFMILTSNGQNIYPEELEAQLNNLPDVSESVVVERNQKLVAIVTITDDARTKGTDLVANEILETINAQVPAYSRISKVEILEGEFEHTPKHSIKRCLYK